MEKELKLEDFYNYDLSEDVLLSNWDNIIKNYSTTVLNTQRLPKYLWKKLTLNDINNREIIRSQKLENIEDLIEILNKLISDTSFGILNILARQNSYIHDQISLEDVLKLYREVPKSVSYIYQSQNFIIFNKNLSEDWINNNLNEINNIFSVKFRKKYSLEETKRDLYTRIHLLKLWESPVDRNFIEELKRSSRCEEAYDVCKYPLKENDDFWWEGWHNDPEKRLFLINKTFENLGMPIYDSNKNKYYLGNNLEDAWIPLYLVTDFKYRPLGINNENVYRLKNKKILYYRLNYTILQKDLFYYRGYDLLGSGENEIEVEKRLNVLVCKCMLKDIYWDSVRTFGDKGLYATKAEVLSTIIDLQKYSPYKRLLPINCKL